MNGRHSHRQQVPFQGPLDFLGNGFFWPPFGFWPGWGWGWGWGGGWDEGWWGGCDYYPENCYSGQVSSGYPESHEQSDYDVETEEARPMITVYLNDGSGYGALDYWTRNGTFYIETTYGAEKSFPMDQVDLKRTFAENTARGVTFTVFPYPSTSDPGPMLAPDSYAPDCPSPSQASAPDGTSAVAAVASANKASWFGASGRISDRGLAVDSVRSNSPAALIGVQPGDIVMRVNCRQIRSAQDIESAVNSSSGPVWVSYMIQGAWLTDKKITR